MADAAQKRTEDLERYNQDLAAKVQEEEAAVK